MQQNIENLVNIIKMHLEMNQILVLNNPQGDDMPLNRQIKTNM